MVVLLNCFWVSENELFLLNLWKRIIMTTQIIEPTSNVFNVQVTIPDELIGKKVAFSYEQEEFKEATKQDTNSIESIREIFKDCRVKFGNYKFNRDEANDYDDFFEKSKIDFKKDIDAFYDNIHIDMSNYKFDRDEANER